MNADALEATASLVVAILGGAALLAPILALDAPPTEGRSGTVTQLSARRMTP